MSMGCRKADHKDVVKIEAEEDLEEVVSDRRQAAAQRLEVARLQMLAELEAMLAQA